MLSYDVGAGMVVDWEQETGLLMTSGDVRVVRIWDTDREMKVQVLHSLHLVVFLFFSKSSQIYIQIIGIQLKFGARITFSNFFVSW